MPKLSKNAKKKTICLGIRISEELNEQLMDYSGKKGLQLAKLYALPLPRKSAVKKPKRLSKKCFRKS
jgi:hypothetical protein